MTVVLYGDTIEAMAHPYSTGTSDRVPGGSYEKVPQVFEAILEDLRMKGGTRKYPSIHVSKGVLWGKKR